jgi:hypothetical protein
MTRRELLGGVVKGSMIAMLSGRHKKHLRLKASLSSQKEIIE